MGYWDEARIGQVITNLLSNASRHGVGQPITLSVSVHASFGVISVHDRGLGITPEQRERLFEPFRSGTTVSVRLPLPPEGGGDDAARAPAFNGTTPT
ncbi:sensor histidine kinase [Sorangium sp. So ce1151]|uniref:sensor histidine kinase n=1 Tax=Sorangium sp. So ce1151 TaxID=3133332 RepID=UPI003F613FFF